MFHECLRKTNSLSDGKIREIDFMLRNPLKADFSRLSSHVAPAFIAVVSQLQRQCRAEVENRAVDPGAIATVGFSSQTRASDSRWARTLSISSHTRQTKMITVEMIMEDLHSAGHQFEHVAPDVLERLIALYQLTEVLVLLECGVFKLSQRGRTFRLQKTGPFERALHGHWFCGMVTVMSKRADMLDFKRAIDEAHRHGVSILDFSRRQPEIVDSLTVTQVDKTISMNLRFVHKLPEETHKAVDVFMQRSRIAILLHLIWVEAFLENRNAHETPPIVTLDATDLAQLRIAAHIWNEMLALSDKAPAHDKLVVVRGPDTYQLGPLSCDQMLVQYCAKVLEGIGKPLGEWFDAKYIFSCIDDEVPKSRYRVYPGGKAKSHTEKKFDVDLIIEDVEADRLLLCQVKHRQNPELPFFRSHWNEFFMGGMIKKGFNQLTALAESLDNPALINMIRNSTRRRDITADYLKQRTSLVFIHNVNSLGFGRYGDILLYDWPTLRNLLRRRVGQSSGEHPESVNKTYSSRIPLEDVEATIAHMSEHVLAHPDAIDLKSSWDRFNRASMQMEWYARPAAGSTLLPSLKRRHRVIVPWT